MCSSFVLFSLGCTFGGEQRTLILFFYDEEIELEADVTSVSTNGMLVKKKNKANVTSAIEIKRKNIY
jgi:hypothetical protein